MKCLWYNCGGANYTAYSVKRIFQIMTAAISLTYVTLVLYQSIYGYEKNLEKIQSPIQTHGLKQYNNNFIIDNIIKFNTISDDEQQQQSVSLSSSTSSSSSSSSSSTNNHNNNNNNNNNNNHYLKHINNNVAETFVTATPKPSTTELNDIFITVKTTKIYHDTRLALLIKTWFQLAKQQTWFFTDTDDKFYQLKTDNHLINTNCSMGHYRKALCCKMSVEFDTFLESGKKWFCHFDDDNYVNIPKLVSLLNDYSPTIDWYLGKPSIASPLEIFVDNNDQSGTSHRKISFVFATGGAGFCISRALALKMLPIAGIGKFMSVGDRIGLPDDVTMGYIIEYLLKVQLTVVDGFHSHLEPMEFLRQETFKDQITFSYGRIKDEQNIVQIDGIDLKIDPTRFYSLHCHLFPYFSICSKQKEKELIK